MEQHKAALNGVPPDDNEQEAAPHGAEPQDSASAVTASGQTGDADTSIVPAPARVTKQSMLIAMLSEEAGASLDAIVEATGWQTHTVRAAFTGLRKKGHAIERSSVDGETRYRIIPPAAAQ